MCLFDFHRKSEVVRGGTRMESGFYLNSGTQFSVLLEPFAAMFAIEPWQV